MYVVRDVFQVHQIQHDSRFIYGEWFWLVIEDDASCLPLSNSLILSEKLYPHLQEIDETANRRLKMMIPDLMKSAGVAEQFKASDPVQWIGLMNMLNAQAEEIILSELIYV